MKKTTIIIIFLVLFVGVYFAVMQNKKNDDAEPSDNVSTLRIGDNAIYVDNQKPNFNENNELNVSMATLAVDGYIVIHKDNEGSFGAIIGASELLPSGDNNNIPLNLTEEVFEGDTLYAMLHSDNGDGVFVPADDAPIVGDDGNPIYMIFNVSDGEGGEEMISL